MHAVPPSSQIAAFHTVFTLGFAAAAAAGFYVYFQPLEYNAVSECPRLITFTLVSACVISAYIILNLLSSCIKNAVYQFTCSFS